MKTLILILGLSSMSGVSFGQIRSQLSKQRIVGDSGIFKTATIGSIQELQGIDIGQALRQDREEAALNIPFRFGISKEVNFTITNSGEWFNTDGGRVWKLQVKSPGAYSLNLIFNQLFLPEGAVLYIYNESKTMLYGPIGSTDVSSRASFATDLIQGASIILELFEPVKKEGQSAVQLTRVIHGYKNMFHPFFYGDADPNCTLDVSCTAGGAWYPQSDGVAMVLLADGTRLCSGALLNNGCQDFTPSFLTAFHCLDVGNFNPCEVDAGNGVLSANELARVQNYVFRFQYKTATCDGPEPTQWFTFNGSTFRAGWWNTDFALLQMNQRPMGDVNTGIKYQGWARYPKAPTSGATLGHPQGDVMKIATFSAPAVSNANPIPFNDNCFGVDNFPANTHWTLNLTVGRTQGGSSGGPLFLSSGRVVGQLHGGLDQCDPQLVHYGRLDDSWVGGGTLATGLNAWLTNDPALMSTDILAAPYIVKSGGGGYPVVCSTAVGFNLINPPPTASHTVTWTVTPNLQIISQGSQSVLVSYSGTGNGQGTITANISSTNTAFCTGSTPFSLNVQAGPFAQSQIQVSGPSQVCPGYSYNYTATTPGGVGVSYSWTFPSGWSLTGQSQNQVTLFVCAQYGTTTFQ